MKDEDIAEKTKMAIQNAVEQCVIDFVKVAVRDCPRKTTDIELKQGAVYACMQTVEMVARWLTEKNTVSDIIVDILGNMDKITERGGEKTECL